MGPAATSAMAVGEIRNVVLKYINSPHALARAARVSIAWHKDAIKYLWRGVTSEEIWQDAMFRVWRTPDIMTLCKLAQNIARFRHYAGHIKYLTLWWKGRKVGNPQDAWIVEVPDLWSASPYISVCLMNIYTNMAPARSIQCLLKPALRALELGDCLLTEGLASAIKVSRHHTRHGFVLLQGQRHAGFSEADGSRPERQC